MAKRRLIAHDSKKKNKKNNANSGFNLFSLENHKASFKESWNYIFGDKAYLKAAGLTFLLGILLGLSIPEFLQKKLLDYMVQFITDLTLGKSVWELFTIIFTNNARINLYLVVFGIFIGVVPFFILIANGAIMGIVLKLIFFAGLKENCLFTIFLAAILPHGIIEIPAFLISGALGYRIAKQWIYPEHGTRLISVWIALKKSIIAYVYIIIWIVILAAFIETFITPLLTLGVSDFCGYELGNFSLLNLTT